MRRNLGCDETDLALLKEYYKLRSDLSKNRQILDILCRLGKWPIGNPILDQLSFLRSCLIGITEVTLGGTIINRSEIHEPNGCCQGRHSLFRFLKEIRLESLANMQIFNDNQTVHNPIFYARSYRHEIPFHSRNSQTSSSQTGISTKFTVINIMETSSHRSIWMRVLGIIIRQCDVINPASLR